MNRKFEKGILLLSFVFIISAQDSQIVNSNTTSKCSTTRFSNKTTDEISASYCLDLVKWPVSQATFQSFEDLGKQAQDMYTRLYQKWKDRSAEQKNPSNDCLGVARIVFCAYSYPYCDETNGDENAVCDFLCDIWRDRCPDETETYNQVCKKRRSSNCAFSSILSNYIFGLNAILIALVLFITA